LIEINHSDQYEELLKIENRYFVDMVLRCKKSGANLIICQWGFDDEANHLLVLHDLTAIRWVGGVEMELISLSTGANILPRFQELTIDKLGFAKLVMEVFFGTSKNKSVFIESCLNKCAVTILIRGCNKVIINETKRSMTDALYTVRNIIRSKLFCYGGGSSDISCSIAIFKFSNIKSFTKDHVLRCFAIALIQIAITLAENAGLDPLEAIINIKKKQINEGNDYIGLDCTSLLLVDIRDCNILEIYIGKFKQLNLSNQISRLVLKIDDILIQKLEK